MRSMKPDRDICVRKIKIPSEGRNIPALVLSPKKKTDKTPGILWIHGGGYIAGMKEMVHMSRAVDLVKKYGAVVFSPGYRMAFETPYPAALEDAITGYNWLLQAGWQEHEIVVAGDSAGGGLALALCMYLKNQNRKLPAGLICMSPWTDLTQSGASYDFNYERDPLFGNTRDSLIYSKDYIQDEDPTNPYISPLYGNFSGFPPMLIQVGSYEMLLSDSELVAEKAKRAGCKVRLSVYEGMFHIFQMAMLMIPESKHAWQEIGRFLDIMEHHLPAEHLDEEDKEIESKFGEVEYE